MDGRPSPAEPTATTRRVAGPEPEQSGRAPNLIERLIGAFSAPQPGADHPHGDFGASDSVHPEARKMMRGVARLRNERVIDVMVPRADIDAVEVSSTLEELMAAFREASHSRMPVFKETLDDPLGFVHMKDVALRLGLGGQGPVEGYSAESFALEDFIRPMIFAPPSMSAGALLQRMQASRIHMALVIDEFGGVDGLATIEDLVELVVGDIDDEHDEEEGPLWRLERDGVWLCEARAELKDFEADAGVDLLADDLDEEVDTLGGLVFMLANRIPARGEIIGHPDGHEFEIVDADPRRIKRLRISLEHAASAPTPLLAAPGDGARTAGDAGGAEGARPADGAQAAE